MADQPQDSNAQYGPFTSAITGPLTPQIQTPSTGYAPSKAAALASFANSFIQGAQKGERTKYERSEQAKQETERNFDSVYAHIASNPNISTEGKQAAEKAYLTAKYSQVNDHLGKTKDKDNPLLGFTKSITSAVLGPAENKKHKDLGIDVNSLLNIANDPKYKIDPTEAGAAALGQIAGAQKQPQAQPGQAQAPASQQPVAAAAQKPAALSPPTGQAGSQPVQPNAPGSQPAVAQNAPLFMAPGPAEGLVQPGNINLKTLPPVQLPGGKWGTVNSASREVNGKEILYPTIVNGKQLSDDEAWQYAQKTGKNLGVFKDGASADVYAQRLHSDWEAGKIPGVQMSSADKNATPPSQRPAPPQVNEQAKTQVAQTLGVTPQGLPQSQNEFFTNPKNVEQWNSLARKGVDPATGAGAFSAWWGTLPKGQPVAASKGVTVGVQGADGKITYQNALQTSGGQLVNPDTQQPIKGAFVITPGVAAETRATAPPKTSSASENRKRLVDDYVALGKTPEQAEALVAKNETQTAEKKATGPSTPEDKLAKSILDSGKTKDPAEAQRLAGSMMVDLENATIKAKARAASGGAGGGPSLTTPELQALVQGSIMGLVTPQFGRGANDPNRLAYLKTYADTIAGNPGDAASTKLDAKALGTTLTQLEKTKGSVGAFEGSANKALDNALEASKALPRDSSSWVNAWDQWLTKGSVDDPKLRSAIVYTETAANEYARVIGSLTGASTNAAREQANSFISTQMAQGGFDAAVKAMKTDMKNRIDSIDDKISETRQSIRSLGPSGTGGTGALKVFTNKAGTKFEVGKPALAPDGKKYVVTAIDADGTIHTADKPVQ